MCGVFLASSRWAGGHWRRDVGGVGCGMDVCHSCRLARLLREATATIAVVLLYDTMSTYASVQAYGARYPSWGCRPMEAAVGNPDPGNRGSL